MKSLKKQLAKIPLVIPTYLLLKKGILSIDFLRDIYRFTSQDTEKRFPLSFSNLKPFLLDKTEKTHFEPHYTYHPAWAARVIAQNKPKKHIDISSILHFSTLVSAFIPVEFYDYRPAHVMLPGLMCKKGDLLALPFADNSVESISCMHTVEHIGLGRYGDPIDPEGDIKAMKELMRVVAPGGTLIFVTPVSGNPRLEFNAHRIYSYTQIRSYFKDMELKEFSLIPDNGVERGIIPNATQEDADAQRWGCGCFWFVKK